MPEITNEQRRAVIAEIQAFDYNPDSILGVSEQYKRSLPPLYSPVTLTGEEVKALDERCKSLYFVALNDKIDGLRTEVGKIVARSKGE